MGVAVALGFTVGVAVAEGLAVGVGVAEGLAVAPGFAVAVAVGLAGACGWCGRGGRQPLADAAQTMQAVTQGMMRIITIPPFLGEVGLCPLYAEW